MKHTALRPPARFLPMTRSEMEQLGWDELDVLLVTGDAYIDHPSFGAAVIGRTLEAAGYRVGIIAQPDWQKVEDFTVMGRPRLFAGVTAGAMDSMLSNYTANKKIRHDDAYTPGGKHGKRPNYPSIVYTNMLRQAFKDIPVVLGGIEASLRRFAHYDYWKESVRRSILLDSKANLIVAGMGELQVVEIAQRLDTISDPNEILRAIPGTVESCSEAEFPEEIRPNAPVLPSYEDVLESKRAYLDAATKLEIAIASRPPVSPEENEAPFSFRDAFLVDDDFVPASPPIIQRHGDRLIVEWPPRPVTTAVLDAIYALPFQRKAHPSYKETVPAIEPVRFSITTHRGCFGGCAFCALTLHQGRHVVSRSEQSILIELEAIAKRADFKGTIPDVGGPTANMYAMRGRKQAACAECSRVSCVYPAVCPNMDTSHATYTHLLERALRIPKIKHLFIASGVRYDLLMPHHSKRMTEDARAFIKLLVGKLTGGHLSVAPEHASPSVLALMRKPPFECFRAFEKIFEEESVEAGKEQYLIPYFIAAFPGSTPADIQQVRTYLKEKKRNLQQIQDFVPAPMTIASALYYTEMEPEKHSHIQVPKSPDARKAEREALTGSTSSPARPGGAVKRPFVRGKGRNATTPTFKFIKPGKRPNAGEIKKWVKPEDKSAKPSRAKWSKPEGGTDAPEMKKWSKPEGRPERYEGKKWEKPEGRSEKPEGRTWSKPEGKTWSKPEGRPERSEGKKWEKPEGRTAKPEGRTWSKPEGKTWSKPEGRPERSEGKKWEKPEGRTAKPEGRTWSKPEGKTWSKPEGRPERSEGKKWEKPEGRTAKPEGRTWSKPEGKTWSKPEGRPERSEGKKWEKPEGGTAKPEGRTWSKPEGKTWSKPEGRSNKPLGKPAFPKRGPGKGKK